MSSEIKEILDRLESRKNWYLHQQKNNSAFNDEDYMAYMVLDYITNLQEENKRLNNIIKDVYEFVEWHYKDNQGFYKNKGIGLNYPECDYVLDKLKEGNKC